MIKNSTLKKIDILCGATTMILGILFLFSAISFVITTLTTETSYGLFKILQNIWLIVILKLHAGLLNIQDDPLKGLNLLDIFILLVFSASSFGMYINLRKSSKIWTLLAFILTLSAIILFLITQIAGRSTVMLSVLIFSLVMLKDKSYGKVTICTGILGSVFLFAGDLTVGIHSDFITILFGIGYILLTIWFFLISQTLLWLSHHY